jgi:hypothetical protein
MDEGWFGVLKFLRHITRKPEVRVLVYRAGDEAWDIRNFAEDVRERVRERRGCLNGTKMDFSDVVPIEKYANHPG